MPRIYGTDCLNNDWKRVSLLHRVNAVIRGAGLGLALDLFAD